MTLASRDTTILRETSKSTPFKKLCLVRNKLCRDSIVSLFVPLLKTAHRLDLVTKMFITRIIRNPTSRLPLRDTKVLNNLLSISILRKPLILAPVWSKDTRREWAVGKNFMRLGPLLKNHHRQSKFLERHLSMRLHPTWSDPPSRTWRLGSRRCARKNKCRAGNKSPRQM